MTITVPFIFGLGSRYSYLAATQLEAIEQRTGCTFDWLPLQSAELIRRANGGSSPFEGEKPSGQYDWAFRARDAKDWADFYGVPYTEPADPRHDTADMAKACWAAHEHGKLKQMCMAVFEAKFVSGEQVSRQTLETLADGIGLNGAALIERIDAPEVIACHDEVMDQALDDGVFGVPAFLVNGKMFWGNDRLPLVEHALAQATA
ncbi:MAG: 2-hydroxychromene-2-carboxylate isomerase [Pseudomonadota bacterium]